MKIICISAHPDDETLGCGGTLLKHADAGHDLYWLIVTRAHEPQWSREIIEAKAREVASVAETYGMKDIRQLGYPAAKLDTLPRGELIEDIRGMLNDVRPELVYLVHGGDVHDDHRIVFSAVMSALKPIKMKELGVRRVFSYETISSTEASAADQKSAFIPNVFNDIGAYMDRKLDVMRIYATEAQQDHLPRGCSAIRALARYRGATMGVEYAEAFMLIRELV